MVYIFHLYIAVYTVAILHGKQNQNFKKNVGEQLKIVNDNCNALEM